MSKQIASKPQTTVADAERVLAKLERGALFEERLRNINPQQRCSLALSYR